MRTVIYLLSVILLTFFILGCSGGDTLLTPPPAQPAQEPSSPPSNGGNGPASQSYLGYGHPIEGVNNRRNNRSQYLLPQSLDRDEKIDEPFDQDYPYTKGVSELVIDGDEQIFLGRYDGGGQTLQNGYGGHSRYQLFSFRFGDGFGDEKTGGRDIVLTNDRVYTTSYKNDSSQYSDMGYGSSSSHRWSYLLEYDPWPVLAYEVSTYWGRYSWFNTHSFSSGGGKYGNWDGRFFDTIFPLPNGNLLISYKRPRCTYVWKGLQLLDDELDLIDGVWLGADITGSAYDENTSRIYTTTDMPEGTIGGARHLYCFDTDLTKLWDADSLWKNFSEWLPVIDDEGGVVGVYNSFLRRIDPDGINGQIIKCGAQTRPAILNDGTIAVICETYLKYFDTELNEIARFPLPSGPESGKEASHAPLVDALDNMALILGPHLCIVDREGNVIAQRTFEDDIKIIRLGPEHLFVALDYAIYRFPA